MLVYIMAFFSTLLFSYLFMHERKSRLVNVDRSSYLEFTTRKIKYIRSYVGILFVCFVPIIIMAIRYNVGTDYAGTYTIDFYLIKNGFNTRNEPLSSLLYWISAQFCETPQLFFALSSVICVYLVYIGIFRTSVNPVQSIVLYFITYQYFTSMNGVRQMMATSIVFLGLNILLEKRYKKFAIVVCVAGLVHYAAFIYILLIPLMLFNLDFKKSFVSLMILIGGIYLFKEQLYALIELTPYSHYLVSSYSEYKTSLLFIVVNILVYFIMGLFQIKHTRYRLLMNIQMVIIVTCMIQEVIPLAGRIVQLFSFYRILIIPEVAIAIDNGKDRQLFNWGIYGFYVLYCIYGLLTGWDSLLPYQTIFTK